MRSANSATRVLIVEDERIVARDIERCLVGRGFRVSGVADTAEAALQSASAGEADLLLMDVRLRGAHDGIWAAQQIRRLGGLPVVFLTAHGDPETLERAKRTGPYAYLLKPFSDEELVRSVEVALALHKVQSELCRAEIQETVAQLSGGLADEALHTLFGLTSVLDAFDVQVTDRAEFLDHLDRVRRESVRFATLVTRLDELGHAPGEPAACRVLPLASQAIAAYQDASSAAPCRIEIDVSPHHAVLGDALQLQIAFRNLLGNAIEHSPADGVVRLTARSLDVGGRPHVECEVSDEGGGFAAELQGAIRPFVTTRRGALGLGLAIAQHVIVRQHGGQLELGNREQGGARVVVRLPAG